MRDIRTYASTVLRIVVRPATLYDSLRLASEKGDRLSATAIVTFCLINVGIATAVLNVITLLPTTTDARRGFDMTLASAAIVVAASTIYGAIIHGGHKILGGRGRTHETMLVTAQVISVAHVMGSGIFTILAPLANFIYFEKHPIILHEPTRLPPWLVLGPVLCYFLCQGGLLVLCLPRALAPVHRMTPTRSFVACFIVPTTPFVLALIVLYAHAYRIQDHRSDTSTPGEESAAREEMDKATAAVIPAAALPTDAGLVVVGSAIVISTAAKPAKPDFIDAGRGKPALERSEGAHSRSEERMPTYLRVAPAPAFHPLRELPQEVPLRELPQETLKSGNAEAPPK